MLTREIMTKNIITATPETTVLEALNLLIDNKISGVPVVDSGGNLLGLVSEKDLLIVDDFISETNMDKVKVAEFMTKNVLTVSPDTPTKEVATLFVQKGIKRAPVVENGKMIGIISRRDVLKSIRMLRKD